MKVLIVGASVRAAACSAKRGGIEVAAIDRFGDVDLVRCGQNIVVEGFPTGVVAASKRLPAADWLYTGPLENRPRLISQISENRCLLGNSASAVRRVRNPYRVMAALQQAGVACPTIRAISAAPQTGKWLEKPLLSGGGVGIAAWEKPKSPIRVRRRTLLQEFIPGRSMGVVYLANGRESRLLGVTLQIVGAEWCGASGFQYAGSIGPIKLPEGERQELELIGEVLASTFHLEGLFGVDVIQKNNGRIWPLEVNPRYCASVEILELAHKRSHLLDHIDACRSRKLPEFRASSTSRVHGKAIVYATCDLVSPRLPLPTAAQPEMADIPQPGTTIRRGQPILTIFSEGSSAAGVKEDLVGRVHQFRHGLQCEPD